MTGQKTRPGNDRPRDWIDPGESISITYAEVANKIVESRTVFDVNIIYYTISIFVSRYILNAACKK